VGISPGIGDLLRVSKALKIADGLVESRMVKMPLYIFCKT
jgi:hypothetical protein